MLKKMALEASDIIAIITILGCLLLTGLGKNGTVTTVLLAITSFYFGQKTAKK